MWESVWLFIYSGLGKFLSLGLFFTIARASIVGALSLPPKEQKEELWASYQSGFLTCRRRIICVSVIAGAVLLVGAAIYLVIASRHSSEPASGTNTPFTCVDDTLIIVLVLLYIGAVGLEFYGAAVKSRLTYLMARGTARK